METPSTRERWQLAKRFCLEWTVDEQLEEIGADVCPSCYCPKDKRAVKCRRCWRWGDNWWMHMTEDDYRRKMNEIYGSSDW